MKKIVLCPNPARDIGYSSTLETIAILEEAGLNYSVCPLFDQTSETRMLGSARFSLPEDELPGAYMAICFGGDGTIMRTARIASRYNVPVLSINKGNMGFIAELESVDRSMILKALNGDYRLDTRLMLDIAVNRNGERIYGGFALNDAVISKGGTAKVIGITAYSDGSEVMSYRGDGIIIATPTGSTGYSMSAGGPLIEPQTESIIITPICAHSMTARAFVVSRDRTVTVELGSLSDREAYLSVDGGSSVELKSGDVVSAIRSN